MASTAQRIDGREFDQLRPISLTCRQSGIGEGSVLIEFGNTHILCVASLTGGVPCWCKRSRKGWMTAEYAVLPRITSERFRHESIKGKVSGHAQEISRLTDRSPQAIIDVFTLGESAIVLDCGILRADGGAHTVSVAGAYATFAKTVHQGNEKGITTAKPGLKVLANSTPAVSVGITEGVIMLNLPYEEDVRIRTNVNTVQTGSGGFTEVQGTAEHASFNRDEPAEFFNYASIDNIQLTDPQKRCLQTPAREEISL